MAKGKKTGGRKVGSVNKTSATLKTMILGALDAKGGMEYLQEQADANPTAFMTLLGKIIPTQLTGDPDSPVKVEHTFTWRGLSKD